VCYYKSITGTAVDSAVRSAVYRAVYRAVGSAVDSVRLTSFVWPWFDGHWMANFFAYYDYYFNNEMVVNPVPCEYNALKSSCKMDLIYPFDDICIVSQNPTEIHLNNAGFPHCESGPAVRYQHDGYYFLNGVNVGKEIVDTPAEKLDPAIILSEKNAEVRREIVRKIGIERVCQKLGAKIIDSGLDYVDSPCELIQLEVQGEIQKYIKLINPSVAGIYHIEGVPNECQTVKDALNSRKPEGLLKIPVDDTNGADWYEQGDVCVWPKNAKFVKSKPIILT